MATYNIDSVYIVIQFFGIFNSGCVMSQSLTMAALHSFPSIEVCGRLEPRHDISNNVVCATNKATDQPALTRSLVRAFASRLNIILLLGY